MSKNQIKDRFSKLKISRQRKYQLRKVQRGLCSTCGEGELFTKHHCLGCAAKIRDRQARRLKCKKRYRCKTRLAEL